MDILIVGGFLGSGKTSLIMPLLKGMTAQGLTCAVVENEIGEVGIDDALIEETGLQVTPLFGGCVCCQISGNLISAIHKIQDDISPDWVVVEMTGLALMDGIRDVFVQYGRAGIVVHTVSVVDLSRWVHLRGALAIVFDRQVAGADLVLLNKTDVREADAGIVEEILTLAPGAKVLSLSADTKTEAKLWPLLSPYFKHEN